MQKNCWYCDRPLGLARRLKGDLFCSREHEQLYHAGQSELALSRVIEFAKKDTTKDPLSTPAAPKSTPPTPPPAPAASSAPAPTAPPVNAPLPVAARQSADDLFVEQMEDESGPPPLAGVLPQVQLEPLAQDFYILAAEEEFAEIVLAPIHPTTTATTVEPLLSHAEPVRPDVRPHQPAEIAFEAPDSWEPPVSHFAPVILERDPRVLPFLEEQEIIPAGPAVLEEEIVPVGPASRPAVLKEEIVFQEEILLQAEPAVQIEPLPPAPSLMEWDAQHRVLADPSLPICEPIRRNPASPVLGTCAFEMSTQVVAASSMAFWIAAPSPVSRHLLVEASALITPSHIALPGVWVASRTALLKRTALSRIQTGWEPKNTAFPLAQLLAPLASSPGGWSLPAALPASTSRVLQSAANPLPIDGQVRVGVETGNVSFQQSPVSSHPKILRPEATSLAYVQLSSGARVDLELNRAESLEVSRCAPAPELPSRRACILPPATGTATRVLGCAPQLPAEFHARDFVAAGLTASVAHPSVHATRLPGTSGTLGAVSVERRAFAREYVPILRNSVTESVLRPQRQPVNPGPMSLLDLPRPSRPRRPATPVPAEDLPYWFDAQLGADSYFRSLPVLQLRPEPRLAVAGYVCSTLLPMQPPVLLRPVAARAAEKPPAVQHRYLETRRRPVIAAPQGTTGHPGLAPAEDTAPSFFLRETRTGATSVPPSLIPKRIWAASVLTRSPLPGPVWYDGLQYGNELHMEFPQSDAEIESPLPAPQPIPSEPNPALRTVYRPESGFTGSQKPGGQIRPRL